MTDKFVTIATYSEPMLAHIAQAKLEAEGIESFIADEHTVGTVWLYAILTGGAKLQVNQNDAQQARQILQEKTGIDMDITNDEHEETLPKITTCPQCGSDEVYFEKYSRPLAFISILILRFPIPFVKRKWKCSSCGHLWKG